MLAALGIQPLHVEVVVVEQGQPELLRLFHPPRQVHELPLRTPGPEQALPDHLPGGNDRAGAERGAHGDEHRGDAEIAQAALGQGPGIEFQRTAGGEKGHPATLHGVAR